MENMFFKNKKIVKYEIEVLTGLHIGGNSDCYGIGGVDSPVIKNPINNEPIIPGSSIKGKIRMLLDYCPVEQLTKRGFSKDDIKKAFGSDNKEEKTITRILFRDLSLTRESSKKLQDRLGLGFFTEVKAENKIDKENVFATPRFIERVPASAIFEGEYIVQYLSTDDVDYGKLLEFGFELLECSSLGASGSRGYGHISFRKVSESDK